MNIFLRLLAGFYRIATAFRNVLFDKKILKSYRSRLPVISVGNVTAGGNAKTPIVIFLVQELLKRGFKPVVLSRGYGGSIRGPHLVSPSDSAATVGDEPLLIQHATARPVVIAARRVAGASYIEAQALGDVIVLDDGFQHRWLERDIDIVSVNIGTPDARAAFIQGDLLPFGLFREGRTRALQRADIVIFSERKPIQTSTEPDSSLFRIIPRDVQLYRSSFEPRGVLGIDGSEKLSPVPVVAFCGIANPDGFFQTLGESGFPLLDSRRFPDHHVFGDAEISQMKLEHPGVPLVCTEKDAIRIPANQRQGIYMLRIEARVTPADAFVTQICRAILKAQRSRSASLAKPVAADSKKSSIP